nr:cupin domain-containing protein [Kineococcus radiotolerans]
MGPAKGPPRGRDMVRSRTRVRRRLTSPPPGPAPRWTRLRWVAVDPLADLLAGPRARGAFVLRCDLDPPWALRVHDRAPLTVVAVVSGWAWVLCADAAPQRIDPGDVAVVRGPAPYVVADDPATPPPRRRPSSTPTSAAPPSTAPRCPWGGGAPGSGATATAAAPGCSPAPTPSTGR